MRIFEQERDAVRVITISVDKSDVGRIIGKEGQTIKAIRALAFALTPDNVVTDIVIDES